MSQVEKRHGAKGSEEANLNTILSAAKKRAEQLGIKSVIVASTSGDTGIKAVKMFTGYNVVVVTHSTGFSGQDVQELIPENRERILNAGGKILTTTHAFGGLGRAVRREFNTFQTDEIVANTLRVFGQGTKVAIEIAMMAADSGLISTKEDVISIGGSGSRADTALVLQSANVQDFFDVKVREIICKPWL